MRTKRKKTTNTGIRNGKLFCFNCGGSQKIPFPIGIPMLTAMTKQFDAEHTNCLPEWKQPLVDQSLSTYEKAKWWLENGERGTSSETILSFLCGELLPYKPDVIASNFYAHPCDPDDFRRCYMLIQTIPEWRKELYKLMVLSTQWHNIIENWDKLCWLLEEQLAGKQNDMWGFMKTIGC